MSPSYNAYGSGNHLTIQRSQLTVSEKPENDEFGHSFVCRTCPYEFVVDKEYYNRRMSRVKKVDDVMGGAAAWQNVDQTIGTFPDSLFPPPPLGLWILRVGFRRCCCLSWD